MKTWIIGTLIIGSIFYVLAGSISKKAQKIVNRDYEIVAKYTDLLEEMSN